MSVRYSNWPAIFFILLTACKGSNAIKNSDNPGSQRSFVRYAERFDILRNKGYSELIIKNPWQGAENEIHKYILVRRGDPVPDGIDTTLLIRVPLEKIICMSTTHISMISVLNEETTIRGISGAGFIFEKKIRELIAGKGIADVGYEDNLNKEVVIKISPDLVMVYGIGNESSGYISKLKELGIKIMFNADYLETDPLGKAEWVKVFGALYCKESEADSIFDSVSGEYNKLKSFISGNITNRPSVFLGLPWKDTWFISPGNSYMCKLISDAGGDYLWKETKSDISMPFGLENVYIKAINADIWLNPGSIKTRDEIISIDKRLGELPSFKKDAIFNNIKRITAQGGNDYWEKGNISPQIVLKDIAAILHPDLFPGYELYFYKRIE